MQLTSELGGQGKLEGGLYSRAKEPIWAKSDNEKGCFGGAVSEVRGGGTQVNTEFRCH